MLITGTTYSVSHYKEFEKTGNKDIFEDIIDSMIMDGIAGMNESFRRAISSLPKDKKRLAILSILDKDRNLFAKIKESITDINLSKIDHVKNIILMLREYVKIAEVEKKKFGEVMTPLDLVKEMLNTLPAEVWSNPNLKWLDPANGTGPFPAVVIYKLMKGLESWEPDADKRYKHIIENMIYVCELQPKNMFLYLCTVDPKDELACNIYTGSFLDEGFDYHMKNVWNVEKFDIVIGNPPYQTNTSGPKSKKIDKEFIKKSTDIISNFLLFVSPKNNILYLNGIEINQSKLDKKVDILHINVNNIERYFPSIGSDFCYYLISINNNNYYTIINNEHKVKISHGEVLPYDMDINSIKILQKLMNYRNDIGVKKSRIEKDLSVTGEHKIVTKILVNNIEYMYSSKTHKDMFKPKVLFALYGNNHIIDYDNNLFSGRSYVPYVLTNNNEESENLVNFTKSKIFEFLKIKMNSMQYPFEFVLKNVKGVDLSFDINDEYLYNYYNLDESEIKLIEKVTNKNV